MTVGRVGRRMTAKRMALRKGKCRQEDGKKRREGEAGRDVIGKVGGREEEKLGEE